MWLRISEKYKIAVLNEILMKYRKSIFQITNNYHDLKTDLNEKFPIIDKIIRKYFANITINNLKNNNKLKALDYFICTRNCIQLNNVRMSVTK